MIRASIAGAILAAAALAFLLPPNTFGAGQRRALAVTAVRLGAAPIGAGLLRPLAKAGDAIAQNDLGVLLNRGIAGKRDPIEAARLLNDAASAGLARAQLNLLLLRTPAIPASATASSRRWRALRAPATGAPHRSPQIAWSPSLISTSQLQSTEGLLAMAAIATAPSDPDEELKFGWLLLKRMRSLEGSGSAADALRPRVARQAARYLFRAAEHKRAAAYEGISMLAAEAASLLAGDAVAARVAARSAAEWIEVAAEAGHPKSRCAVGVTFATRLAADGVRASDADRKRLAALFQTCLSDCDPRQIFVRDGREQTIGYYRLFDVWMQDEAFLVQSPHYDNYDHDIVAQEDAVRRIASLARQM